METEVPDVAPAANGPIARKPLVLNGITIEVDPQTLMVNATQMCKAVPSKKINDFIRLNTTKSFIKMLESKTLY